MSNISPIAYAYHVAQMPLTDSRPPNEHIVSTPDPEAEALRVCDARIAFYQKQKERMRVRDNLLQVSLALATGATALIAALQADLELRSWAVVVPAVIVTISSNLNSVFRFRVKYVNAAIVAERLISERLRYLSSKAPQNKNLEAFIGRVDKVVAEDLVEWSELHRESPTKDQVGPANKP